MEKSDKSLEFHQREELLLERVARFRNNLLVDCHYKCPDSFILEVMDRKIADHREFLVSNFLRDLKVQDAHDIKDLITKIVVPRVETIEAVVEKRGRGNPGREVKKSQGQVGQSS